MPQLKPIEAAGLANAAYLVKNMELSLINPVELKLPPNFVVGSRVSGVSGLGPGTLSGFGFVASGSSELTRREVILAIRGTDGAADALTDALIGPGVPGPSGTAVHAGFNRTWKTLQEQIERRLPAQGLSGLTVHCVGHSLGGALATLAADYLSARGAQVKLYTFGCPRVGMIDFAQGLTARAGASNLFRVYHPADPVAMVPLFPFTHVPKGETGYALACGPTERIRPGAHKMVDSYMQLIGDKSYAALAANGAQTLSDRQIEAWLRQVKEGGWIQNYGARAMEMVGIALDWVLRKILEGVLIGLQPYLAAGVSLLDTLAYVLYVGAKLVKEAAWYVEAIMMAILKLVGRTVRTGVSLTLDFIRWVLDTMMQDVLAMARTVTRML